ncbi:unnamed protein product [Sphagnum jensenii]
MSFHPSPLLSSPSNHTAWLLCLQTGSAWCFEHGLHAEEEEEMLMQQENCSGAQQIRNQKDKSHTRLITLDHSSFSFIRSSSCAEEHCRLEQDWWVGDHDGFAAGRTSSPIIFMQ